MKYVAPGVYTLEGLLMGRVYLIEDPDGLTIIDGSISRSTPTILKEITQSGHKLVEIKRILLTHAHPDHVGRWRNCGGRAAHRSSRRMPKSRWRKAQRRRLCPKACCTRHR